MLIMVQGNDWVIKVNTYYKNSSIGRNVHRKKRLKRCKPDVNNGKLHIVRLHYFFSCDSSELSKFAYNKQVLLVKEKIKLFLL